MVNNRGSFFNGSKGTPTGSTGVKPATPGGNNNADIYVVSGEYDHDAENLVLSRSDGNTVTISLEALNVAVGDHDITGFTWDESNNNLTINQSGGSSRTVKITGFLPDTTTYELGDLTDVTVTGVTNGQVLTYNGSGYVFQDVGHAEELTELDDVSISSPTNGQVLKYNGTHWINDTDEGVDLTAGNGINISASDVISVDTDEIASRDYVDSLFVVDLDYDDLENGSGPNAWVYIASGSKGFDEFTVEDYNNSTQYILRFNNQDIHTEITNAKYLRVSQGTDGGTYSYYRVSLSGDYVDQTFVVDNTPVHGTDIIGGWISGGAQVNNVFVDYTDEGNHATVIRFSQDHDGLVPGPSSTEATDGYAITGDGTWVEFATKASVDEIRDITNFNTYTNIVSSGNFVYNANALFGPETGHHGDLYINTTSSNNSEFVVLLDYKSSDQTEISHADRSALITKGTNFRLIRNSGESNEQTFYCVSNYGYFNEVTGGDDHYLVVYFDVYHVLPDGTAESALTASLVDDTTQFVIELEHGALAPGIYYIPHTSSDSSDSLDTDSHLVHTIKYDDDNEEHKLKFYASSTTYDVPLGNIQKYDDGRTYTQNDTVWFDDDDAIYVWTSSTDSTAGTDPSDDTTNWVEIGGGSGSGSNVPDKPSTPASTTKYELQITSGGTASWETAVAATNIPSVEEDAGRGLNKRYEINVEGVDGDGWVLTRPQSDNGAGYDNDGSGLPTAQQFQFLDDDDNFVSTWTDVTQIRFANNSDASSFKSLFGSNASGFIYFIGDNDVANVSNRAVLFELSNIGDTTADATHLETSGSFTSFAYTTNGPIHVQFNTDADEINGVEHTDDWEVTWAETSMEYTNLFPTSPFMTRAGAGVNLDSSDFRYQTSNDRLIWDEANNPSPLKNAAVGFRFTVKLWKDGDPDHADTGEGIYEIETADFSSDNNSGLITLSHVSGDAVLDDNTDATDANDIYIFAQESTASHSYWFDGFDDGYVLAPRSSTERDDGYYLSGNGTWQPHSDTTYTGGNGIDITSDTITVDLVSTGGLQFSGGELQVFAGHGIELSPSGAVQVDLDGSTITRTADGISVTNPFTDDDETNLDNLHSYFKSNATGTAASASGTSAIAIGDAGVASSGTDSIAIGSGANASANDTIAIGRGAAANTAGEMTIGSHITSMTWDGFSGGDGQFLAIDANGVITADTPAGGPDGIPDAPANQTEAKSYVLNVPASSGDATWTESSGSTVDFVSNVASNTILGRNDSGSGNSEELTPAEVRSLINVADGSTASNLTVEEGSDSEEVPLNATYDTNNHLFIDTTGARFTLTSPITGTEFIQASGNTITAISVDNDTHDGATFGSLFGTIGVLQVNTANGNAVLDLPTMANVTGVATDDGEGSTETTWSISASAVISSTLGGSNHGDDITSYSRSRENLTGITLESVREDAETTLELYDSLLKAYRTQPTFTDGLPTSVQYTKTGETSYFKSITFTNGLPTQVQLYTGTSAIAANRVYNKTITFTDGLPTDVQISFD